MSCSFPPTEAPFVAVVEVAAAVAAPVAVVASVVAVVAVAADRLAVQLFRCPGQRQSAENHPQDAQYRGRGDPAVRDEGYDRHPFRDSRLDHISWSVVGSRQDESFERFPQASPATD